MYNTENNGFVYICEGNKVEISFIQKTMGSSTSVRGIKLKYPSNSPIYISSLR
jgi:hypothetical protein